MSVEGSGSSPYPRWNRVLTVIPGPSPVVWLGQTREGCRREWAACITTYLAVIKYTQKSHVACEPIMEQTCCGIKLWRSKKA